MTSTQGGMDIDDIWEYKNTCYFFLSPLEQLISINKDLICITDTFRLL